MQRTSSCTWVKGILEMFASQGVDVAAALRSAGIDAHRLEQPAARFTADEVTRLWDIAVATSGDPTLGLSRGLTAKYVDFDVVAYAMLSSPDLHRGLESLARYTAVVSDAASFDLQHEAQGHWLVLGGSGNTLPVPRQRYAYGMLALVTLCEWLTRREIQPIAVEFMFPQPAEGQRYRSAFRCEVRFGRPENRMLLARADLLAPLPSRNPCMRELHEQVLRERLVTLQQARTSHRVTAEIMRRLALGEPRREEIAACLALADRTLQRRLRAESTSFQQLLEDARIELARKYLSEDRHTLQQVADLLGFVDQSNFFRACRRWFGEPPGQYRRRLASERALRSS